MNENINNKLKEIFLRDYGNYLKSFLDENEYKYVLGILDEDALKIYRLFQYLRFLNFSSIEVKNVINDINLTHYLDKISKINYSDEMIVPGIQISDDKIVDLIEIPKNSVYEKEKRR